MTNSEKRAMQGAKEYYACSGYLSRAYQWWKGRRPPYEQACYLHDIRYRQQILKRWEADAELLAGVARRGYPKSAIFMWLAVRAFGWWHWRRIRRAKALMGK